MRQEIITEEEIYDKVILSDSPVSHKAFVLVLWFTGIRRGEILSLTTRDIGIEDNFLYLKVETLKKRQKHKTRIVYIPLDHPYTKYILMYISKRLRIAKMKGKHVRIFPWSPKKAHMVVKSFCSDWYPHLFRHTRAVLLAQSLVSPWEHAEWFGWSDLRMTMIYYRMAGRYTRETAEKMWIKSRLGSWSPGLGRASTGPKDQRDHGPLD